MKIAEVSARPPQLVQQLVEVWQRSVQATHLFLSAPEIAAIRTYVPQALCGVEHLIVAQDESGTPVGFMGVQENRLEMLFLDPCSFWTRRCAARALVPACCALAWSSTS